MITQTFPFKIIFYSFATYLSKNLNLRTGIFKIEHPDMKQQLKHEI